MPQTDNRDSRKAADKDSTGFVHVRGAREHNLKDVSLDIPRELESRESGARGVGGRASGPRGRRGAGDQKPIGRTPRSNLATYTGLFDTVRKLFAATKTARARHYDAGRFSFNVAKGRCATCEGEGLVFVELLFLPSVYAPSPTCHGARYNAKTLEIEYREKNIADVLRMTVDGAFTFFADEAHLARSLDVLRHVGLGYLRLSQPATELSGGEAQRIKLATEFQRMSRGNTRLVANAPRRITVEGRSIHLYPAWAISSKR